MNNLQTLMRNNILNAIDDYFRHSYSTDVRDDISDSFVNRLADNVIESKRELRELFRQSDGWNEQLQAIVINGTKTHNPDYILVHNLANSILTPAKHDADWRKIDFKLFVSINPAHFLTMSNPKDDNRGSTLTSCHSFNVADGEYNCGCSGYARDHYTFIVFTAADPDNPEMLNNRKTSRQIFAYKPYNGLLLQSRLYNTSGGTCGNQTESKLYRDLIQRELSELEGVPNLWQTEKYCDNKHGVYFRKGEGFGGYCDWSHRDFNAKISIRADHAHDFQTFEIGTYGLCICCGEETSEGLYCSGCDSDEHEFCQECEERCRETFDVINCYGERIHVCANCLDEHYRFCERCEEYRPKDEFVDSVCRHCHELEEVSA